MKSMFASLALQTLGVHRYGFLGIDGLFGIFIGLICLIVLIAICWKILSLLLPALGVGAPWVQIIYWLFVLCVVVAFMHLFGLY